MHRHLRIACGVLLVACLVSGCGSDEDDWAQATESDTVESYRTYLEQRPEGQQTHAARTKIQELEETRDWTQARAEETPEALRAFLSAHPQARRLDEARSLLARRLEDRAWTAAKTARSASDLRAFIETYASGEHTEEASALLEQVTWAERGDAPTLAFLERFLTDFPSGQHAAEAGRLVTPLREQRAWTELQSAPATASLEAFLRDHPDGKHAGEAKVQLAGLKDAEAWERARTAGTPGALESYLEIHEKGAFRTEASTALRAMQYTHAWNLARAKGTPEAIQAHLFEYPVGKHSGEAQEYQMQLLLRRLGYGPAEEDQETAWATKAARLKFGRLHFDRVPLERAPPHALREHLTIAGTLINWSSPPGSPAKRIAPKAGYRLGVSAYTGMPFVTGGCHASLDESFAENLHITLLRHLGELSPGQEMRFFVLPDLRAIRTGVTEVSWTESRRLVRAGLLSPRAASPRTGRTLEPREGDIKSKSGKHIVAVDPDWFTYEDRPLVLVSADAKAMVLAGMFPAKNTIDDHLRRLMGGDRAPDGPGTLRMSLDKAAIVDRHGADAPWLLETRLEHEGVRVTGVGDRCSKLRLLRSRVPLYVGGPAVWPSTPPLHAAARAGDVQRVQSLLAKTAVDSPQDEGATALYVAAQAGQAGVVDFLLEKGADPNLRTKLGATPLHVAADIGNVDIALALLGGGASTEALDQARWTPLHIAADAGHEPIVVLLLARGARPVVTNKAGKTAQQIAIDSGETKIAELLRKSAQSPLHAAAEEGDVATVRRLLEEGADVSAVAHESRTALHIAAMEGHVEVMKVLLDAGAAIEARDSGSATPLHQSVASPGGEAAALLLERGADVHAVMEGGVTALHAAAQEGRPEAARALLRHGARHQAKSAEGIEPLYYAVHGNHADIVESLLERGASVNALVANGGTALFLTSVTGNAAMARLLLDSGAKVDVRLSSGDTPLFAAAKRGQVEVVRVLLEYGADVNARAAAEMTALMAAAFHGSLDAVRALVWAGADTTVSVDGHTSLELAQRKKHEAVARFLGALQDGEPLPLQDRFRPIVPISRSPNAKVLPAPEWARVSALQLSEARRLGVPVAFENDLGMRFVLIPQGLFRMGWRPGIKTESGLHALEKLHWVTITRPYYLQITEVTNAAYRHWRPKHQTGPLKWENDDGSKGELDVNGDRQPVADVTYDDAVAYARWLSGRADGRTYRVPTEAEWEHAARAATDTPYFWGPDLKGAEPFGRVLKSPADVGTLRPNPWGLHDVVGSVMEWCSDWQAAYPAEPAVDPQGPSMENPTPAEMRSNRGNCSHGQDHGHSARSAWRPDEGLVCTGFRLVVLLPEK